MARALLLLVAVVAAVCVVRGADVPHGFLAASGFASRPQRTSVHTDRVLASTYRRIDADGDGVVTVSDIEALTEGVGREEIEEFLAVVRSVYDYAGRDGWAAVEAPPLDGGGGVVDDLFNETRPVQVHLSHINATMMVVMWVTHAPTDASVVRIAPADSPADVGTVTGTSTTYDVGVGGWHGRIHTVHLTGLKAGTRYRYQCGDDETGLSDLFSFSTAVDAPVDTALAIVGDMGTFIPDGHRVLEFIAADNAALAVAANLTMVVGDLAYAGTGRELEFEPVWDVYGDLVEPLAANAPFMASVGNHEMYYNFSAFRHRYTMPGFIPPMSDGGAVGNFWYSFDYGNIHVLSMSTEHDHSPTSPQWAWIKADLEAVNRTRTPWLLVTSHRPMYGSDEFEYTAHIPGSSLQQDIEPLLVEYHVDAMIYGHCHVFEMMYPVIDGVPTVTGTNVYVNPNATVHVLAGTGGAIYPDTWAEPQPAWSNVRLHKDGDHVIYGYGRVDTNATHLHYQFREINSGTTAAEFWIVHDADSAGW